MYLSHGESKELVYFEYLILQFFWSINIFHTYVLWHLVLHLH